MPPANEFAFEEDGYATVIVGDARANVDLWKANNLIAALQDKHSAPRGVEYVTELCDLIASLGLPKPSHKLAIRIADTIAEQVQAIEGKVGPAQSNTSLPDSAGSTDSIVSDSVASPAS